MSNTVIKVENLSKKYVIGHQSPGGYATFRDAMTAQAKALGRRILHPFNNSTIQQFNDSTTEDFWALKDVSFEIKQGDRVGIIGRNGAGKSTLLKVLSRITEPTSGRITIDGRVASLLEVGTGFHPELTGRENIFLNGAILGMRREEIKRKFDEIVDFAEVEKFLDTPVKRYSSGMYVRLAFAVAAHLEPEILIVDEVLAVGDSQFQKKCLGKMEEVGREGRTVLFVSHNMSVITALCEKVLLLESGRLDCVGETAKVVQKYLESGCNVAGAEVKWQGGCGDETIKLYAVRILNNQGEVENNLDVTEDFFLELDYDLFQNSEDLRVGFRIMTQDAMVILLSLDTDTAEFKNKDAGRYRVRARVPGNFLNIGKYLVSIVSDIPNNKISFFEENCINFTIEQTVIVGGEHGIGRLGVVRPLLVWKRVESCDEKGEDAWA